MHNVLGEVAVLFSYPKHLIILGIRLTLAYGFSMPALMKINDIKVTSTWFESIAIPLPTVAAYLVSALEIMGIVLLVLGLFTRQIAIFLSFIMLGAMFFVHAQYGYSVENNGIEIPLYYLLFLIILASFGAGKYSLDNLIFKDGNNE